MSTGYRLTPEAQGAIEEICAFVAEDSVDALELLTIPAGNRLERLRGEQAGRHSVRINDQYRVTFRWEKGHAFEVRVEDYH